MKKSRFRKKRDLNPAADNRLRDAVVGSRPTHFGYLEYLAERDEILKLKWLESEKLGRDIGSDCALNIWVKMHRKDWLRHRVELFRNTHPNLAEQQN